MADRRVKSYEIKEFKADQGKRTITGYASIFGNLDLQQERVLKGAFAHQFSEVGISGIKVLWNHNMSVPVGKPNVLQEDKKGLYFEAPISATAAGNDLLVLVADGVVDTMSIGFDILESVDHNEDGTRDIVKAWLYEISPVTFAANTQARIQGIKACNWHQRFTEGGGTVWVPDGFDGRAEILKEGRVLSTRNRNRLNDARGLLDEVLKSSEVTGEDKNVEKFLPPGTLERIFKRA